MENRDALLVIAGALYALGYQTTPRLDRQLAFLGQKRPHDLMNKTRRHEFPNADIGRRAPVVCAEVGAKQQVPDHHVLGVILVSPRANSCCGASGAARAC